jgi:hypothetical protein
MYVLKALRNCEYAMPCNVCIPERMFIVWVREYDASCAFEYAVYVYNCEYAVYAHKTASVYRVGESNMCL